MAAVARGLSHSLADRPPSNPRPSALRAGVLRGAWNSAKKISTPLRAATDGQNVALSATELVYMAGEAPYKCSILMLAEPASSWRWSRPDAAASGRNTPSSALTGAERRLQRFQMTLNWSQLA